MFTPETSVFVLVVNLLSFSTVHVDSVVNMDQLFDSNHNSNNVGSRLNTPCQLFFVLQSNTGSESLRSLLSKRGGGTQEKY